MARATETKAKVMVKTCDTNKGDVKDVLFCFSVSQTFLFDNLLAVDCAVPPILCFW
jgi:hypothetical protein